MVLKLSKQLGGNNITEQYILCKITVRLQDYCLASLSLKNNCMHIFQLGTGFIKLSVYNPKPTYCMIPGTVLISGSLPHDKNAFFKFD